MHNKTYVTLIGWTVSVGGWWLWNSLLSLIFKPNKTYPLYPMYQNFTSHYGRNFAWWLVLFLTLAALTLFELGVSSVRKTFWPSDTDVFQELQKDPMVRARFEETVRREAEGGGEVPIGKEGRGKTSDEVEREGEIRELLERPRVMSGEESGSLHGRRISTDVDDLEVQSSYLHSSW
jgi:phospholipid-translocating ATPase